MTLPMASPVRSPRPGGPAWPAWPSVNTTASRLPAPAPIRTASAAAREASSVRARREVAGASAVAMVDQTQTRNTSAAMSSANSAETDHDAPPTTATAAATAPPATPTITRRAARPERAPVVAAIGLLLVLACVGREQALEDAGPTQAGIRLSPHALAARTRALAVHSLLVSPRSVWRLRHGPLWPQPLVDGSIQRRGDEMKRAMKGLLTLMFLRRRSRRSRHAHR